MDHRTSGVAAKVEHLTDSEFERACSFVARTYGLDMNAKRILLECRLSRERERLGLPSFNAYLDIVESGDTEVRRRFVDLVTTHYTYFMRESSQFAFLCDTVFPRLARHAPEGPWNILCAGCSTGEECYTISMVVEDFSRLHPVPKVLIEGVDVSEPALQTAVEGRYASLHVDKAPPHWRSAYFERAGDEYIVADRIRRRVTFRHANLSDEHSLRGVYDVIFCRNTIIYFTVEAKERAIARMHRHLAPSGYLALGHAEVVVDRTRFAYQGNSIYQKLEESA